MRTMLKRSVLALVLLGVGAMLGSAPKESAAAFDAARMSKALATFKPGARNASPVVQHGTHLCSAHSHCGSGHLCCSGHCKAVQTCG